MEKIFFSITFIISSVVQSCCDSSNGWVDITESSRVGDIIGNIQGHSMTSFKNDVVVTGGVVSVDSSTLFYSRYVYSLKSPYFDASLVTSRPDWTNRAHHATISYKDENGESVLWLFGGIDTNGALSDSWYSSNLQSWTSVNVSWPSRFWHSVSKTKKDGLILFGGLTFNEESGRLKILNDVWISSKPYEHNSWTQVSASQCSDSSTYLNALIYDASMLVEATKTTQITCKSAGYSCSDSLTCCKGECAETLGQQICKSTTLDYDRELWTFSTSDGAKHGRNNSGTCDEESTPWYSTRYLSTFSSINETSVLLVGGVSTMYSSLDSFRPGRQLLEDLSPDVWIYSNDSGWTQLMDLPDPVVASGLTVVGDKLLLLGGTSTGMDMSQYLWCLGCDSTGEVTTTAPDPSNDDHPSSVLTYVPWVIAVTALVFGLCVVLMYSEASRRIAKLFSNEDNELREELLQRAHNRAKDTWILDNDAVKLGQAIGFGSSGTVFRATYRGASCAVKKLRILSESMRKTVFEEASLNLRHPNICYTFGICVNDDQTSVRIVMELCRTSIGRMLIDEDSVSVAKRYKMALDICRGMAFLHSVNIVHRDLKPDNCLVSHDGNVKICDFGVSRVDARRLTRRRHKNAMITTGHAGSPLFMPPEALRGDAESAVHKSQDIYSFGILCWILNTWRSPYEDVIQDMTPMKFMEAVCTQGLRPSCKRLKSEHIKSLLERCWHDKISNRPECFEDAEKVLIEIGESGFGCVRLRSRVSMGITMESKK